VEARVDRLAGGEDVVERDHAGSSPILGRAYANPGVLSGDVNLVVGATGLLGGEICRLLAGRDLPLRTLVRATSDPAKVESLRRLGAEIVVGDLKEPETLVPPCTGVEAVVSTVTCTTSHGEGDTIESVDRDGQLALVAAAARSGVRRFVFISFPEFAVEFPLQTAKRTVEDGIRSSGLEYTILRPTSFQEVWLAPRLGFDPLNGQVQTFGSGDKRVSWVSCRDVARFAVEALGSPAARDAVIDLGGPEALSHLEVVRIFEEESGRRCAVAHVPEEALEAQMAAAGDSLQASFAGLMLGTAREGQAIDMEPVLREFPLELTSVRDYARALAAA
jgi:NADH dehydrogenase